LKLGFSERPKYFRYPSPTETLTLKLKFSVCPEKSWPTFLKACLADENVRWEIYTEIFRSQKLKLGVFLAVTHRQESASLESV